MLEEEVIEYLGTAPCLAFVGAGLSAECGLPTWKGLAERLSTSPIHVGSLMRRWKGSNAHSRATISRKMFRAEIVKCRSLGEAFLYDNCREPSKSSDKLGSGYTALVRLPFQAYFTN